MIMVLSVIWLCYGAFIGLIIYGPPYPSGLAPWRRSKAKLVIEHKGPYRLRISLTDGGGRGRTSA